MELSVKENPEDDRNMHYLGREYMYYGRYEEAVSVLKKHLSLKNATWKDERCASMRYTVFCLSKLNRRNEAFLWLLKSCAQADYLREPWLATAEHLYEEKKRHAVITFAEKALEITNQPLSYITDTSRYKEKPCVFV